MTQLSLFPAPDKPPEKLQGRLRSYPIWSSWQFRAGQDIGLQKFRLFSLTMGSTGQGFTTPASYAETNMQQAGLCPNGYACDVTDVGIEIFTEAERMDGLEELASHSAFYQSDLNTLLRGVWAWDFLQMILPGGAFMHPKLPSREQQNGWPEGQKVAGCYSSLYSYPEPIELPEAPFYFGTLLQFPKGQLKRDAVIRMTLFLLPRNGVTFG